MRNNPKSHVRFKHPRIQAPNPKMNCGKVFIRYSPKRYWSRLRGCLNLFGKSLFPDLVASLEQQLHGSPYVHIVEKQRAARLFYDNSAIHTCHQQRNQTSPAIETWKWDQFLLPTVDGNNPAPLDAPNVGFTPLSNSFGASKVVQDSFHQPDES